MGAFITQTEIDWERKKSVLCLFPEWSAVILREDHPYPAVSRLEHSYLWTVTCAHIPQLHWSILNIFSTSQAVFFFFFFYLPGSCLLGEVPGSVVPELKITSHPHMFFFFPLLYELGFKSWPWFSEKIKLGHSQCLICIHLYEFCNLEDVSNPGKCNHEPTAKTISKGAFSRNGF